MFTWNCEDPLVRAESETQKANDALNDYYFMGSGRSLRKLLARYIEQKQDTNRTDEPPTVHWKTLSDWSTDKHWQDRIKQAKDIENKNAREKEREDRRKIITGFKGQFSKALIRFDPNDVSLGQITQAFRALLEQSRAEYDDLPTQRQKSENLNIDLSNLTDDQLQRIASGEDPVHVLATTESTGSD